jgi:hypothetical protein
MIFSPLPRYARVSSSGNPLEFIFATFALIIPF